MRKNKKRTQKIIKISAFEDFRKKEISIENKIKKEVNFSKFNLSKIKFPRIKLPKYTLPKIKMPSFSIKRFNIFKKLKLKYNSFIERKREIRKRKIEKIRIFKSKEKEQKREILGNKKENKLDNIRDLKIAVKKLEELNKRIDLIDIAYAEKGNKESLREKERLKRDIEKLKEKMKKED